MLERLSQTAQKIRTSRKEIFLQIFFVFIFPVVLLQTGILPISYRVFVLIIVVSLFLFLLLKEEWTFEMLHIEVRNLKKYFFPYLVFTVAAVIIINTFGEKIGREELALWWSNKHFLYLFLVVSIFQEVAYRGYLIPALRKLTNNTFLIVIINAILFAYMHAMFTHPLVNLPLAFVGGLAFAAMYIKYPNLLLIIASHAALNFSAVLLGFFTIH